MADAVKVRRPRLTRKRIEGLGLIGHVIDQQLLRTLLTREDVRKVKTARQWIGEMCARQEQQGEVKRV